MYDFTAKFVFKNNLNDFLPNNQKFRSILYEFNGNPSIKDAIEAIGIPHTEVALIMVNRRATGFEYQLQNKDSVVVYPENVITSELKTQSLRAGFTGYKFILDVNLGKLARLIRMIGFDGLYNNSYDDAEIEFLSVRDNRIVLTRDRKLLKRKMIRHGYWVRSTDPKEQIKEVINRFKLTGGIKKFHRCITCNGVIRQIEKHKIIYSLEPLTKQYFEEFYCCNSCRQIYWKGSHYEKMKDYMEDLYSVNDS